MTITPTGIAAGTRWTATAGTTHNVGSVTSGRRVVALVWQWSEADDPFVAGDLTRSSGATINTPVLITQTGGAVGGGIYLRVALYRFEATSSGALALAIAGAANGYGAIATDEFRTDVGWDDSSTPTNGQVSTTDTLTTYNSGNAVSGGPGLFIGALAWNTSGNAALALQGTPNWVSVFSESDGNVYEPGATAYRIVTADTTSAATWNGSMDGASYCGAAACVAVLKEVSGAIDATAADTITFSDSAVSVTERVATASDTFTPSDSAVSVTERVAAANDAATFSDSAVSVTERVAAASDTFTASDSAEASVGLAAEASDTVGRADRVATADDTFSPSDSAVSATERAATADDTFAPSDSAVSATERVAVATDSVVFTDTSEGFIAVPAEASDTFSPSDSAVSASERVAVADDTFSPSDSAVGTTDRVAAADDTFSPSDSAVSATERLAEAADSVTFTDSGVGSVVTGAAATAEDTFSPSDSAVSVTERVATAADSIALTDSALADLIVVAAAVDSVTFSDSAEGLVPRDAEAVDSVAFSDSGTAVVVPPTPTSGGRAWLRAWLQQQYTKDFEEYERRRAERKAPTSAPTSAGRRPATPPAPSKTPATPTRRSVETTELAFLVAQFSAAVKSPPPLQFELPPLPSLDGVKAAAAKRPAPEFTAEDEELVLQIARTLNL